LVTTAIVAFNRVGKIIESCGGGLWSNKLPLEDECPHETSYLT
jgi:hypothetical protein